jgi:mutator protein MutT
LDASESEKKLNLKKRTTWLGVVAAVIRKENKVLLGLRPAGSSLPDLWEFPGGKIELGESPVNALKRELHEELGIDAEIGRLIYAGTHTYGKNGIILLFYEVKYWKGTITPKHHTDLKWYTPEEVRNLSLPEANKRMLEELDL